MENNTTANTIQRKRTRQSKPTVLVDGTVCYTLAVRYPYYILDALRELCYEKELLNMTETIFYCIEGHKSNELLSSDVITFDKKDVSSLTIRFRENHYKYIQAVCKTKELKTFSNGIIHILYEYLKVKERL